MTFYGQEKVEYNAQLCLMNMAVHGLTGVIKSGNEANTFYNDAHNLAGCCDYVMAIIWSDVADKCKGVKVPVGPRRATLTPLPLSA
jgi:type I restriction-modification system DNA methylase subunit